MIYGLIHLPWWGYLLLGFILTHITAISISIFLHRNQAHRALTLHPSVSHFFRFWLWLTTGMKTKEWTAIHRKHHARCETKEDPHSPVKMGIKTVLLQGSELYRREAANQDTLNRYGQGTPDDWIERNVYSRLSKTGVTSLLILEIILFGLPGIAIWATQMLWTPFFAAGIINGVGHYLGYRNYESNDASRNILPIGFLIAGEELHNNHHAFATSAKFSVKPWEFDISWGYIKLFTALGLAQPKRLPPKPILKASKNTIDLDTVKAVFHNRLHIMSEYSKTVIRPTCKKLKIYNAKLCRDLSTNPLMLSKAKQESTLIFLDKHHPHLKIVYQFQTKFHSIWENTTATHKELLESLQNWCKQAKETGILALAEFANSLNKYSLTPA